MTTWLWTQDYSDDIFTDQASADAFVDLVAGKFTDVMLTTRADDNGRVWFNSDLTIMRPERIDGQPGGVYLLDKLHERGVRVHAWFYTGFWGTYIRMHELPPIEWNMNHIEGYDTSWSNYSIAGMRDLIAAHTIDIMESNDLDGAHLDYLRLRGDNLDTPLVSHDDITDVARLIRAGIDDKVLTAYFSGRGASMALRQKRDVVTWLTEPGLFDALQMGSYITEPLEDRRAWLESLPENHKILPGVPTFTRDDDGRATPSYENFTEHTEWWNDNGYTDLAYFDSWTLTQTMVDWMGDVEIPEEPPPPEIALPDWLKIAQIDLEIANHHAEIARLCSERSLEFAAAANP